MDNPPLNILLTGGTGYIGSHTAVVLAEASHQVILYDNLSNSPAETVPAIRAALAAVEPQAQSPKQNPSAIRFIQGDTRDTRLLTETLQQFAIDAVIHFAGLKAVGESVEKPIDYYANNVQGTLSLLQAMEQTAVKTLVFSSCATVYGEPRYLPLDEDHPTRATNPYGRTKLQIEEILADVAQADATWRILCLRYFNPVGAHPSGWIGENPNGIPNNLMPYIAQVAAGKRTELNVFGHDYPTPDGTGIRDYIHVMDLAEGHAAALDYLATHNGWHAINLGTGQGYSVLEMVHAFEAASGRPVPYRIVPRRAGDVAQCYANPEKAACELGWVAKRGLAEMCASTWRFQARLGRSS